MRKLLLTAIILTLCTGCWPFTKAVPEGITMSAKLTKSGLAKIDSDYDKMDSAVKNFLTDPSDINKEAFKKAYAKFGKGFRSMVKNVGKFANAVIELGK